MITQIAIGAAAGGGAGFVSGFIASLMILWGKDKRNDILYSRGLPGAKDRVRSRFEIFFGLMGLLAGPLHTAMGLSWWRSMIVPGVIPILFGLVMALLTIRDARE